MSGDGASAQPANAACSRAGLPVVLMQPPRSLLRSKSRDSRGGLEEASQGSKSASVESSGPKSAVHSDPQHSVTVDEDNGDGCLAPAILSKAVKRQAKTPRTSINGLSTSEVPASAGDVTVPPPEAAAGSLVAVAAPSRGAAGGGGDEVRSLVDLMTLPDDVLCEVLSFIGPVLLMACVSRRWSALVATPAVIRTAVRNATSPSGPSEGHRGGCALSGPPLTAELPLLRRYFAEEIMSEKWVTAGRPTLQVSPARAKKLSGSRCRTALPTVRRPWESFSNKLPMSTWLDDGTERRATSTCLLIKISSCVAIRVRDNCMSPFWIKKESNLAGDAELQEDLHRLPLTPEAQQRLTAPGFASVRASGVISSVTVALCVGDSLAIIAVQTPWNVELWSVNTTASLAQPTLEFATAWYIPQLLNEAIAHDPLNAGIDTAGWWLRHLPVACQANQDRNALFLLYGDTVSNTVKLARLAIGCAQLLSTDLKAREVAYHVECVTEFPGTIAVDSISSRGFDHFALLHMRDRVCFDSSGTLGVVIDDNFVVHSFGMDANAWSEASVELASDLELRTTVPVVTVARRKVCIALRPSAVPSHLHGERGKTRLFFCEFDAPRGSLRLQASIVPVFAIQHIAWDDFRLFLVIGQKKEEGRGLFVYRMSSLRGKGPICLPTPIASLKLPSLIPPSLIVGEVTDVNHAELSARQRIQVNHRVRVCHVQHERQVLVNCIDRTSGQHSIVEDDLRSNYSYAAIFAEAGSGGFCVVEAFMHGTCNEGLFRSHPHSAAVSSLTSSTSLSPPSSASTTGRSPSMASTASLVTPAFAAGRTDRDQARRRANISSSSSSSVASSRPSALAWVRAQWRGVPPPQHGRSRSNRGGAAGGGGGDSGDGGVSGTAIDVSVRLPRDTRAHGDSISAPAMSADCVATVPAVVQPLQWTEYINLSAVTVS